MSRPAASIATSANRRRQVLAPHFPSFEHSLRVIRPRLKACMAVWAVLGGRGWARLAVGSQGGHMQPSQSRPPNSQYREREIAACDSDAESVSPNQRINAGRKEPEYYVKSPPVAPPTYGRYSGFENYQFVGRPSISKRVLRAVARFSLAVLVGVGATLGWQSYGDKAGAVVRAWAPSLSWLLPVSATGSPVATLPELVERLKPMSLDLAIVRRSLEQLAANQNQFAAKQEQIAQNVATLQEAAQEIRQAVYAPSRKLQSPTGQPSR